MSDKNNIIIYDIGYGENKDHTFAEGLSITKISIDSLTQKLIYDYCFAIERVIQEDGRLFVIIPIGYNSIRKGWLEEIYDYFYNEDYLEISVCYELEYDIQKQINNMLKNSPNKVPVKEVSNIIDSKLNEYIEKGIFRKRDE